MISSSLQLTRGCNRWNLHSISLTFVTSVLLFKICSQQRPVAHAQGQTLYISYGHKSNEELLLGYGFVLPHNVANFVKVTISRASRKGACTEAAATQPSWCVHTVHRRSPTALAHTHRMHVSAGDGSRAGLALRDSVKAMLGLPDDHFLRVADALPSSLLAAASVALLSEPRTQRVHGHLQRSLTSHDTGFTAPAPAAAPQQPDAGETAMDSPSSQLAPLQPPSLPANVSSLVMGSPQEQLHALRAVLRNLKAKLADLGGERTSASWAESCAAKATTCNLEGGLHVDRADSSDGEPRAGSHASIAVQYMAEQRDILQAAMRDLLQRVTDLLHHASKYIAGRARQHLCSKVGVLPATCGNCFFVLQLSADAPCVGQKCRARNLVADSSCVSHRRCCPARWQRCRWTVPQTEHANPCMALTP